MRICKDCGRPIKKLSGGFKTLQGWYHNVCPSEAERSGGVQPCPPSANSSAGARADALPSLISSVVPRETAVCQQLLTWWRDRRIRKYHEASIKAMGGDYAYALQRTAEAEAIEVCIKDLEDLLLTDAHPAEGERALARNVRMSDADTKI